MKIKKSKVLEIIAAVYLVVGIVGGIVAGAMIGSIGSMFSSMYGEAAKGGFSIPVMLAVWFGVIVQSALIWAFADVVEKVGIMAQNQAGITPQAQMSSYQQGYPQSSYPQQGYPNQNYPYQYRQ